MSSPIGRALIGKAVGDDVLIKLPAKTRRMRILELRTIHQEKQRLRLGWCASEQHIA